MTVVISRRERVEPLHIFEAAYLEAHQGWRPVMMMSTTFDHVRDHEVQVMLDLDQHAVIRAWLLEHVGQVNHFTSVLGYSPMKPPVGLLISFLKPEDRQRFLATAFPTN